MVIYVSYCSDRLMYDDDGYVIVYIDGACLNNGRGNAAAGFGVVFDHKHPCNHSAPVRGRATNNTGEIQAATWAINKASNMGIDQLCLRTDSKFLINAVNMWMQRWKQNGWCRVNGEPLANKTDFQFLDRAMYKSSMDIEFEHVRGHSGDPFNELADKLAKAGARQYYNNHYN